MSEDGQLYSFGYGQHGQLGLRNNLNYWTAQLVRDFFTHPLIQIAAGWHHSLALTARGDLYACGYGESGQLGIGNTESKTQFTLVECIADKNIDQIYAGGSHSWIILNDIDPVRADYRFPEPLNDKSPQQFKDDRSKDPYEEDKSDDLLAGPSSGFDHLEEHDEIQDLDAYPSTLIGKFENSLTL